MGNCTWKGWQKSAQNAATHTMSNVFIKRDGTKVLILTVPPPPPRDDEVKQ